MFINKTASIKNRQVVILSFEGGFMMNIYIEDEYEKLKEELLLRGYNIVDDNNVTCDAIICNLKSCDFNKINSQINLKREGALIIDCGSKSIEEIDNLLNNRLYSNII